MSFSKMFQEMFEVYFGLDSRDTAKWHLIVRYREKVSPRLGLELFKEALSRPSFLSKLPKCDAWECATLELPIKVYTGEKGFDGKS